MLKAWRRVRDYVKYDLREIIAPSSLPYPPGEEELHRHNGLTWKKVKAATQEYLDTWKPEKQPEAKPYPEDRPIAEDLAGIARAGAGTAQPLLQHLYRTRAAGYRDAMREFVEGYREGYAGLPDKEHTDSRGRSSDAAEAGPSTQQGAAGAASARGGRAHGKRSQEGAEGLSSSAAAVPGQAESLREAAVAQQVSRGAQGPAVHDRPP